MREWSSVLLVLLVAVAADAPAAVPTDFEQSEVLGGLDAPVALAHLPDGRLLVAEQKTGNLRLVLADDTLVSAPVLTVPDLETANNEAGLLSLAVDPGWPQRPYVYVHFTARDPREMRLVRYAATGSLTAPDGDDLGFDPASALVVLDGIPDDFGNHNGGTLLFGPDGFLYFSVGDDEDRCAAQRLDSPLGKVLRLDVADLGASGPVSTADLVAAGNPHAGQGGIAALVWALGLRNPYRMAVDAATGELFVGDVGEVSREEISRVAEGGENLGWPFREGSLPIQPPGSCDDPGGAEFVEPIWDYGRTAGVSVVAGFVYRAPDGADHPWPAAYAGDVFFADFFRDDLRRLTGAGQDWQIAAPVEGQPGPEDWANGLSTAADFAIAPDGSVVYASLGDGTLHRIRYVGAVPTDTTSFGALRARYRD
jgi:glucose/arabinose dehydrogenase